MASSTLSIAILSGKGGVGKSNLALNIGYGLHQLGHTTLLMDCDLGLANIDILLGLTPEKHLQDILISHKSASEILLPIGKRGSEGFDFMPANSGMAGFADLDPSSLQILTNNINPVANDYDFLLLDLGAGISPTTLALGAMAAMRILVVTPEPTALTDGYALMKVLASKYNIKDYHILVNQVDTAAEGAQTFKRLASVCDMFLGFCPHYLGHIRNDRFVPEAVRNQRPFMEVYPQAHASADCNTITQLLHKIRSTMLPFPKHYLPLSDIKRERLEKAIE